MGRRIVIPILAFLALSPAAGEPALAQMLCGNRTELLAHFGRLFREVPNAVGITDQGSLIEVLVSPAGTWTMILTSPGGPTCIIGTGQDWQTRPASAEPRV